MGGFQLRLIAGKIGTGVGGHGAQRPLSPAFILAIISNRCAGQGFAQRGVIFQGLGIHHHHVDKLAGHLRGAKHFAGLRGLLITDSCGFRATAARTPLVPKAETISASRYSPP